MSFRRNQDQEHAFNRNSPGWRISPPYETSSEGTTTEDDRSWGEADFQREAHNGSMTQPWIRRRDANGGFDPEETYNGPHRYGEPPQRRPFETGWMDRQHNPRERRISPEPSYSSDSYSADRSESESEYLSERHGRSDESADGHERPNQTFGRPPRYVLHPDSDAEYTAHGPSDDTSGRYRRGGSVFRGPPRYVVHPEPDSESSEHGSAGLIRRRRAEFLRSERGIDPSQVTDKWTEMHNLDGFLPPFCLIPAGARDTPGSGYYMSPEDQDLLDRLDEGPEFFTFEALEEMKMEIRQRRNHPFLRG